MSMVAHAQAVSYNVEFNGALAGGLDLVGDARLESGGNMIDISVHHQARHYQPWSSSNSVFSCPQTRGTDLCEECAETNILTIPCPKLIP